MPQKQASLFTNFLLDKVSIMTYKEEKGNKWKKLNSHSNMVPKYMSMLREWDRIGDDKYGKLTKHQIKVIINA